MKKIITAYDVRQAKMLADDCRYASDCRAELLAKVAKWEQKVAQYGGDIHIATLAKFRAELEVAA